MERSQINDNNIKFINICSMDNTLIHQFPFDTNSIVSNNSIIISRYKLILETIL